MPAPNRMGFQPNPPWTSSFSWQNFGHFIFHLTIVTSQFLRAVKVSVISAFFVHFTDDLPSVFFDAFLDGFFRYSC